MFLQDSVIVLSLVHKVYKNSLWTVTITTVTASRKHTTS